MKDQIRSLAILCSALSAVIACPEIRAQNTRTDHITYHDNTDHWVLGQTASTFNTNTGVTEFRIEFDTATALPVRYYGPGLGTGQLKQTLTYYGDGTVASATDGNNHTVLLAAWKRGVPQAISFPATPESPTGSTQSASVSDYGLIEAVTDENGFTTSFGYDAMGRLSSVTYPQGDVTNWNSQTFTFTPIAQAEHGLAPGHWTMRKRIGDQHVNTYYDALWRPVLEESLDFTDIASTLTQVVKRYDHEGRVIFQSFPKKNVDRLTESQGTHTVYDSIGRVTSVSQDSELGLLTTLTEYLPGFQTRVTNPRGQSTTTGYQVFDQPSFEKPIWIQHPEGAYTDIQRDPLGLVLQITRRNANATESATRRYVYGTVRRLCMVIEPESGTSVFGYDGADNITSFASGLPAPTGSLSWPDSGSTCANTMAGAAVRRVDRSYDARNRMVALSFPDGRGNQQWDYTPDGLPKLVTTHNNGVGSDLVYNRYSYNRRRLMTYESVQAAGGAEWPINYVYDQNASLLSQSYPSGLVINYAPNALGQATQARDQSGYSYASAISYHPNGAIKQFAYGNGIIHSMVQNERQLPASTTDGWVSAYTYAYDPNGNTRMIADDVRGINYLRYMYYDGLDRLIRATSISFGPNGQHTYSYNALDNLTSSQAIGVRDYASYIYDSRNQLVSVKNSDGATVVGLSYDEQGNLFNKNGVLHYFDYGNRLREVSGKEAYRYDAHGRRLLAWSPSGGGIWTQYDAGGKQTYTHSERKGTIEENVYLAGSVIATRIWNTSSASYAAEFHHTDAIGSLVATTNQSGTLLRRYDYEPYGAMSAQPTFQGLGYTGHVHDGATSLIYMQQRYYDPVIGLFLSVDPVTAYSNPVAQFHRYRYANNNPYRFTDPDGRAACPEVDRRCVDSPRTESGATQQAGPSDQQKAVDAQVKRASDSGKLSDGTTLNLAGKEEQGFSASADGTKSAELTKRGCAKCEGESGTRTTAQYDPNKLGADESGGHTHSSLEKGLPGPEDGVMAKATNKTAYVISKRGAFAIERTDVGFRIRIIDGAAPNAQERRELRTLIDGFNKNSGGSGKTCSPVSCPL